MEPRAQAIVADVLLTDRQFTLPELGTLVNDPASTSIVRCLAISLAHEMGRRLGIDEAAAIALREMRGVTP